MMKTLQQIKDEVAKEQGFGLWSLSPKGDSLFDIVARRYAEEVKREAAETTGKFEFLTFNREKLEWQNKIKQSILNIELK